MKNHKDMKNFKIIKQKTNNKKKKNLFSLIFQIKKIQIKNFLKKKLYSNKNQFQKKWKNNRKMKIMRN